MNPFLGFCINKDWGGTLFLGRNNDFSFTETLSPAPCNIYMGQLTAGQSDKVLTWCGHNQKFQFTGADEADGHTCRQLSRGAESVHPHLTSWLMMLESRPPLERVVPDQASADTRAEWPLSARTCFMRPTSQICMQPTQQHPVRLQALALFAHRQGAILIRQQGLR